MRPGDIQGRDPHLTRDFVPEMDAAGAMVRLDLATGQISGKLGGTALVALGTRIEEGVGKEAASLRGIVSDRESGQLAYSRASPGSASYHKHPSSQCSRRFVGKRGQKKVRFVWGRGKSRCAANAATTQQKKYS